MRSKGRRKLHDIRGKEVLNVLKEINNWELDGLGEKKKEISKISLPPFHL